MVSVLFMVGKHLEPPTIVYELLNTEKVPAKPIYDMASGTPLVLFDCGYEGILTILFDLFNRICIDLHWEYCEDAHRKLLEHFETARNEFAMKSSVLTLMLDSTRSAFSSTPKSRYLYFYPLFCYLMLIYYHCVPSTLTTTRQGRKP